MAIYKPAKPTLEECTEYNCCESYKSLDDFVEFLQECQKNKRDIDLMRFEYRHSLNRTSECECSNCSGLVEVQYGIDQRATQKEFEKQTKQYELDLIKYKEEVTKAYKDLTDGK